VERIARRLGLGARAAILAALMPLVGCGDGPPSVSGSTSEATVHGTVKYKGQPVSDGTIAFDPTNINRKGAPIASAPIGKDGTYTIKTLVGPNSVSVQLPTQAKSDPGIAMYAVGYEVPSGDSTLDVDPTTKAP